MKLGAALSAFLGFAIASGSPLGLGISILGPVIWLRQKSRTRGYICALTYYLAALHDLIVVSRNFFGPESGLLDGVCLWILSAGLLSSPWLFAWSSRPAAALLRVPLALLISVIPPLGLIGWASPVSAAGLLFPGTGYVGLTLTMLSPGVMVRGADKGLIGLTGLILMLHLIPAQSPQTPKGWEAVNTHFQSAAHEKADVIREYETGRKIRSYVDHSRSRVLVFPEAVAASWTGELFQDANKIVVLGATEPESKPFDFVTTLAALSSPPQSRSDFTVVAGYKNKLLIRGTQIGEFEQRVPIPIGMWKPYVRDGVAMNLSGPGTIMIDGQRAAIIICYEQMIAWPVVASMVERPTIILAVANNVWVAGTPISKIEQTAMRSWAALFNLPILFAANS